MKYGYLLLPRWFLFFLLLLTRSALGQSAQNPCGADEINRYRLKHDSLYRATVERVRQQANDKAGIDMNTVYTVPVVFVVYHTGEAVGTGANLSDATLQAALADMNAGFRVTNPRYPAYRGSDAKIQFTLAQRTPDCQPFNGIVRVDASSVQAYAQGGLTYGDFALEQQLRQLSPAYSLGGANKGFITLHILKQLSGAAAYASGAGSIFNDRRYLSVLTHEMGHVLFLPHTFEGQDGTSCPPNANPLLEGDRIADTDPHRSNEYCQGAGNDTHINACTGKPFGTILYNYMSYSCGSRFTDGQIVRMRTGLQEALPVLLNSPYLTAPQPTEAVRSFSCSITAGIAPSAGYVIGLRRVQFNAIDKETEATPLFGGFYTDYSCSQKTVVTAGMSYSISTSSSARHRVVYIDYNNDGAFNETDEKVFVGTNGANWASLLVQGVITIPATATRNTYLRMRVMVDTGQNPPTSCSLTGVDTYGYGEIEDFGVLVLPDGLPPAIAINALPQLPFCPGKIASLPFSTSGTFGPDNRFTALLSDATGSFAAATTIGSGTTLPLTVTMPQELSLNGSYRVRIVSGNPVLSSNDSPVLVLEERPMATIANSQTINYGSQALLTINFTGRSPWEFGLIVPDNPERFYTTTSSANGLRVAPASTGLYTISRISNHCGAGTVGPGAVVTVRCPEPARATESDRTTSTIRLSWEGMANVAYQVQWKEAAAANWTDMPGTVTTPAALTGLVFGQTYQWRVRAVCPSQTLSDWLPARTFIMDCPLPSGAAELANSSRAQLQWNSGGSNLTYTVQWREQGSSSWTTVSDLTATTLSLTGLTAGKGYDWQVGARCVGNSQPNFAPQRSFTAVCANPASLTSGLVTTSVRVGWSDALAESYQVRWRVTGSSSWTESAPLTSLYLDINNLATGYTYEWQVRSICGGPLTYGRTETFSTGCDPNEPNDSAPAAFVLTGQPYRSPDLCLSPEGDSDWFRWAYEGKTVYIRVAGYNATVTGAYRLDLSVSNNQLTITTSQSGTLTTDTILELYDTNGTTLLAANDDDTNTMYSRIVYTLPAVCTVMKTVKAGAWNDPAVWSCNRVPVANDAVTLEHAVSVPAGTIGTVLRVSYGVGGRLLFGSGASVRLGM